MKHRGTTTFLSLLLFASATLGQSKPKPAPTELQSGPATLEAGVVVEGVENNSSAKRAGLEDGDFLLGWRRGDAKDEIGSPFDLSAAEMEQAPRGEVTLEGLHRAETRSWTLGQDTWGIKVRPNLRGPALAAYLEGLQSAKAGKVAEAAKLWRQICAELQDRSPQCSTWVESWILFRLAGSWADKNEWANADGAYEEAIQNARKSAPTPIVSALIYRAWADSFQQRSDWANAEKYYQRAIEESKKPPAKSLVVATTLNNMGNEARRRGDLGRAEIYSRQALKMGETLAPESLVVAKSINILGLVAWQRGQLLRAEEYHHRALAIRKKLVPDSLDVAASYNNLGLIAQERGDFAKAEEYYRLDLAITERLAPDTLDLSYTFSNLGWVAQQRGDLAEAEQWLGQGLAIQRKLAPDSLDVARSLNNLGGVNFNRGDISRAEKYFLQALSIKQQLAPDSLDVAASYADLGLVARERSDLIGSEKYHLQALAIREKLAPGSMAVAQSLTRIGSMAWRRGDLKRAARNLRRALRIQESLAPGSLDVAGTLNELGIVTWQRGDLLEAEGYLRRVLVLDKKISTNLNTAIALNNLGNVVFDRGELVKAEEYYRQALKIAENLGPESLVLADTLNNLGEVARKRGKATEAEEYYRHCLVIRDTLAPGSLEYAQTLAGLASLLAQGGHLDAAAQLFEQSLNALEKQMSNLGGTEEARSKFHAKYADYYAGYEDVLLRQNQPEFAFQALERSRARALLETLAQAHIDIRGGVDPKLLERERVFQTALGLEADHRIRLLGAKHTEEEVSTANNKIGELTAGYDDVEAEIRATSPGYAALTQPKPLTAKEVQEQLLDENTLLLEYSLGEKRSFVFAVSASSLSVHELPKRAEIESSTRRVYGLLLARNHAVKGETELQRQVRIEKSDAQLAKDAQELSNKILAPLAEQINKNEKRLLIVGDGALQYIPFAALPAPQELTSAKKSAPLIAAHEIVNLPSASVLAVLRKEVPGRQKASKAVAVLADPVFDKEDHRVVRVDEISRTTGDAEDPEDASAEALTRSLADLSLATNGEIRIRRLPFTRREAEAIMAATPADQRMKAVDFRASRETAMSQELSQYRIVHFATHGLLDSVHPELSGIVLSLVDKQGRPQRGFLELQDIYNLNLSADLVVLSACETGLGKEVKGEGLVGLTRGFMYAGARRVVASLWNVSDAATAKLMEHFYVAMEREGKSPAAALRTAQMEMLKQPRWRSPYYWAAFQIQGDWK